MNQILRKWVHFRVGVIPSEPPEKYSIYRQKVPTFIFRLIKLRLKKRILFDKLPIIVGTQLYFIKTRNFKIYIIKAPCI